MNAALREIAQRAGLEWVATQNVHYATPDRFPVYDALTCVRTGTRLPDVHPERRLNGTNYLTSPQEMAALFPDDPRALQNTLEIARRCRPALPEKPPNRFPAFPTPRESTIAFLRRLTYQGSVAPVRPPHPRIRRRLEHELAVIEKLDVADAFLVAWDLVRFAQARGIRYAAGAPRPTRRWPTAWASPRWTHPAGGCSSSASSAWSGPRSPTSTSTSSPPAGRGGRLRLPPVRRRPRGLGLHLPTPIGPAPPCGIWARRWASARRSWSAWPNASPRRRGRRILSRPWPAPRAPQYRPLPGKVRQLLVQAADRLPASPGTSAPTWAGW